jgi:hypothetical protein
VAPTHAIDCVGNTGPNQCPAGTVCYGVLQTNGGTIPNCTPLSLTSHCAASVTGENPPGLGSSCGSAATPATFNLRMCNAKADCASDSNKNCCNYNNEPVFWCAGSTLFTTSCKP